MRPIRDRVTNGYDGSRCLRGNDCDSSQEERGRTWQTIGTTVRRRCLDRHGDSAFEIAGRRYIICLSLRGLHRDRRLQRGSIAWQVEINGDIGEVRDDEINWVADEKGTG